MSLPSPDILQIAEQLAELDPPATFARRGAAAIAEFAGAAAYRLEQPGANDIESSPGCSPDDPRISLPLQRRGVNLGTLHLQIRGDSPTSEELEILKWTSRLFAGGLYSASKLEDQEARRPGETVARSLKQAPLTPRERDVVSLLVSGSSTREIATRTGLTVSTVNTYLKRIFSKLGVHSRVELVARMAGTVGLASGRSVRGAADKTKNA